MQIVFIGPPGAGKGTQSGRLSQDFQIPQLSTGEMLRLACQRKTALGEQVESYLDSGLLVPDAVVVQIVLARLGEDDCRRGYILDGFPRTVPQAETLDDWLQIQGTPLSAVLNLKVNEQVLLERLVGRGRSDDGLGIVRERLDQYDKLTLPLLKYYQERGVLREIDGLGTPDEVYARIRAALES